MQWWERSPSTNVSRVQFLDSASYVGYLSLLVLYSTSRGFSLGTPVFPSPQKPTFDLIYVDLQSPQLVEHMCSARKIWDLNKVVIIIIIIIITIIIIIINSHCHMLNHVTLI